MNMALRKRHASLLALLASAGLAAGWGGDPSPSPPPAPPPPRPPPSRVVACNSVVTGNTATSSDACGRYDCGNPSNDDILHFCIGGYHNVTISNCESGYDTAMHLLEGVALGPDGGPTGRELAYCDDPPPDSIITGPTPGPCGVAGTCEGIVIDADDDGDARARRRRAF